MDDQADLHVVDLESGAQPVGVPRPRARPDDPAVRQQARRAQQQDVGELQ